jgi:hypothetical protein
MSTPFDDLQMEMDLGFENWMGISFEAEYALETVSFENWMARPFYQSVAEEMVAVESWMVHPFSEKLADQAAGHDRHPSGRYL